MAANTMVTDRIFDVLEQLSFDFAGRSVLAKVRSKALGINSIAEGRDTGLSIRQNTSSWSVHTIRFDFCDHPNARTRHRGGRISLLVPMGRCCY